MTAAGALAFDLADPQATDALGARLAPALAGGGLVLLSGELGAGKTSLVRALLRALGHAGTVRSPTYALVESYRIGALEVRHLDLYRLADAGELEFLGLREWLRPGHLVLVEWPERAAAALPAADLAIALAHAGAGREVRISGRPDLLEQLADAAG